MYAAPFILTLRGVSKLCLIRFGVLRTASIGHLGNNLELYLCEKDANINNPGRKYIDIFYCEPIICNQFLVNKWRSLIIILPRFLVEPIDRFNRLLPNFQRHVAEANLQGAMDVAGLLDRYPPRIKFSGIEKFNGWELMKKLGLPKNTPYVCLISRDSAYLKLHQPNIDFSYHDFRNSEIDNFVLAIMELISRGYYVVRMGSIVEKSININHPRFIHYCESPLRSEFLDIFLGANCEFAVSTGTGWDSIPQIFRKPIVFVNFVTPAYIFSSRKDYIFIFKRYFSLFKNRSLTLKEIFEADLGLEQSGLELKKKGVYVVSNTKEEIRDAVIEMDMRLSGNWMEEAEDLNLQNTFWRIYPKNILDKKKLRPIHGKIQCKIGSKYLRENKDLLE